jgi:hypothetical protein
LLNFPLPNEPSLLKPQHCAVPTAITAQVYATPADTLIAVVVPDREVIPVANTGIELLVVVPLPKAPAPL